MATFSMTREGCQVIVDTSAILAVLFDESDADQFDDAIARDTLRRMSVANYVEATIVSEGRRSSESRTSLGKV